MSIDLSQKHINKKLRQFCEIYAPEDQELIDELNSGGTCCGYTAYWLYAILVSQLPQRLDEHGVAIVRDDIARTSELLIFIDYWNKKNHISLARQIQIRVFIRLLVGFQRAQASGFVRAFADTRNRKAIEEFSLGAYFTLEELQRILPLIVFENRLVFIGSEKHSMGILKTNNKFYYIDSNLRRGPVKCDNLFLLAQVIFTGSGYKKAAKPSSYTFNIFSIIDSEMIDDIAPTYPDKQSILRELSCYKPGYAFRCLTEGWGDPRKNSPLVPAMNSRCIVSINFALEHAPYIANIVNTLNVHGVSLIEMACLGGQWEAVQNLIAKGADIDKGLFYHQAVNCALVYEDLDDSLERALLTIDTLSNAGANINARNENMHWPPLLYVLTLRGKCPRPIVTKLVEKGADTSLALAIFFTEKNEEEISQNESIIAILRDLGANVDKALKLAAEQDLWQAILPLVQLGANPDYIDEAGISLLMQSLLADRFNVAAELLLNGANMNRIEANNLSPLMVIVDKGIGIMPTDDFTRLAKRDGVNATNGDGKTALMFAKHFYFFSTLLMCDDSSAANWPAWIRSTQSAGIDIQMYLTQLFADTLDAERRFAQRSPLQVLRSRLFKSQNATAIRLLTMLLHNLDELSNNRTPPILPLDDQIQMQNQDFLSLYDVYCAYRKMSIENRYINDATRVRPLSAFPAQEH